MKVFHIDENLPARFTFAPVTVALNAEHFAGFRHAIANQRRVSAILARMHHITLRPMWKPLPSTSQRKHHSKKTPGVNEGPFRPDIE